MTFEEVWNELKSKDITGIFAKAEELSLAFVEAIEYTFNSGYAEAKAEFEKPQGEWIKQYGKSYELKTNEGVLVGEFTKCPKCQYDKARGSNFCPNCGADMRGKEE